MAEEPSAALLANSAIVSRFSQVHRYASSFHYDFRCGALPNNALANTGHFIQDGETGALCFSTKLGQSDTTLVLPATPVLVEFFHVVVDMRVDQRPNTEASIYSDGYVELLLEQDTAKIITRPNGYGVLSSEDTIPIGKWFRLGVHVYVSAAKYLVVEVTVDRKSFVSCTLACELEKKATARPMLSPAMCVSFGKACLSHHRPVSYPAPGLPSIRRTGGRVSTRAADPALDIRQAWIILDEPDSDIRVPRPIADLSLELLLLRTDPKEVRKLLALPLEPSLSSTLSSSTPLVASPSLPSSRESPSPFSSSPSSSSECSPARLAADAVGAVLAGIQAYSREITKCTSLSSQTITQSQSSTTTSAATKAPTATTSKPATVTGNPRKSTASLKSDSRPASSSASSSTSTSASAPTSTSTTTSVSSAAYVVARDESFDSACASSLTEIAYALGMRNEECQDIARVANELKFQFYYLMRSTDSTAKDLDLINEYYAKMMDENKRIGALRAGVPPHRRMRDPSLDIEPPFIVTTPTMLATLSRIARRWAPNQAAEAAEPAVKLAEKRMRAMATNPLSAIALPWYARDAHGCIDAGEYLLARAMVLPGVLLQTPLVDALRIAMLHVTAFDPIPFSRENFGGSHEAKDRDSKNEDDVDDDEGAGSSRHKSHGRGGRDGGGDEEKASEKEARKAEKKAKKAASELFYPATGLVYETEAMKQAEKERQKLKLKMKLKLKKKAEERRAQWTVYDNLLSTYATSALVATNYEVSSVAQLTPSALDALDAVLPRPVAAALRALVSSAHAAALHSMERMQSTTTPLLRYDMEHVSSYFNNKRYLVALAAPSPLESSVWLHLTKVRYWTRVHAR